MSIIRQNLAISLGNRAANFNRDELLSNCYPEIKGDTAYVVRRFGYQAVSTHTAAAGRGLFTFLGEPISVIGATARRSGTTIGTVDTSSVYQYTLVGATPGFVLKNNALGYYYNGTTLAQIVDANYPALTVPGVAYLDGCVYVLTPNGRVYNSNVNVPSSWNALNFISTQESDPGIALARYLNYVLAFGQSSMTFFYNANNATGSPLLPNQSATQKVGCANGNSVVETKNTVFWIGQTKQKGRSIYLLNGLNPQVISTPYIDRLLAADDLSSVAAFFVELNGHGFYILNLRNTNITLVYDATTQDWAKWTSASSGRVYVVVEANLIDGIMYLTIPGHGLPSGTVGIVGGTANPIYLGQQVVTVVDGNTVSYYVGANPFAGLTRGGIDNEEIDAVEVNQNIR